MLILNKVVLIVLFALCIGYMSVYEVSEIVQPLQNITH